MNGDKKTILYVDDSAVEREIIRELLEAEGFKVLSTGVPEEGIELACEWKPDLILVDLHLPGMNGSTLIGHLREVAELKEVPVVVISASIKDEEREEVLAVCDGFLEKPVNMDSFSGVIQGFISRGREDKPFSADEREKDAVATSAADGDALEVLEALEKVRAAMSHDLRTPLTVMISYASTVGREKVGSLTERQKEMLDLVVDHGFQMDTLISELVRIAKDTLERYNYPPKGS
jgi:CheY-like chemotaxis protein